MLELEELSILLEFMVIDIWDEERDIVSIVILDCSVEVINISISAEETEYSESEESVFVGCYDGVTPG